MTKILAIQGSDLKKVNIKTDTTILLASEAQKRGYQIYYFEPENLSFLNGKVLAFCKHIRINENKKKFYSLIRTVNFNLERSKVILIRNDPPFDNRYLYTTFLLSHISKKVKIINHPFAVRNISEKLFSINLMRYMPPTLISENISEIRSFFKRHKAVVAKPINGFSGNNVILFKAFNANKLKKLLRLFSILSVSEFSLAASKRARAYLSEVSFENDLLISSTNPPKTIEEFLDIAKSQFDDVYAYPAVGGYLMVLILAPWVLEYHLWMVLILAAPIALLLYLKWKNRI